MALAHISAESIRNEANQKAIDAIVKAWNECQYDIAMTVMNAVLDALTDAGYKLN